MVFVIDIIVEIKDKDKLLFDVLNLIKNTPFSLNDEWGDSLESKVIGDEFVANDFYLPPLFIGKFVARLYYENNRLRDFNILKKLFDSLYKLDYVVEVDSGKLDITDRCCQDYYCNDLDTFIQATIIERWGFIKPDKEIIKKYLEENCFLTEKGILFNFSNSNAGKDFVAEFVSYMRSLGWKEETSITDKY